MSLSLLAKILSLAIIVFLTIYFLHNRYTKHQYKPEIKDNAIQSYMFAWDKKDNLMQGKDMCGAYVFVGLQTIFGLPQASHKAIFNRLSWVTFGQGILPSSLENLLISEGLSVKVPMWNNEISDKDKITVLQNELSQGHPIVLAIKANGPHYVLVLGYNQTKDEIYLYDPFLDRDPSQTYTKDKNGEDLPGNSTLSNTQLLDKRSQGGKFGLYNYYAIIVTQP